MYKSDLHKTPTHEPTRLKDDLKYASYQFVIEQIPLKILRPKIHRIEKLRFTGISQYDFKLKI